MRVCLSGKNCLGLLVGFALFGGQKLGASTAVTLSADEIVQKAVSDGQRAKASAAQSGYRYTKVTITEELDNSGRVKERKEKMYDVTFKGGAARLRLMQVNGRPPGDTENKKESENESNARQLSGSAKSRSSDNKDNILTPEVVARYNFKLLGQAPLEGRPTYELAFEPKSPEVPARKVLDRLLNRLSGTIWIDAEDFEVARADVHLRSEVNLLAGVIGSLKKLTFTMTRTRIAEGVWFNTSSTGDFEGRKLLDATHIKTKSQSTNFRLAQS
jgi:hypothetical protein